MINIEKSIEIIEECLSDNTYKEKENDFHPCLRSVNIYDQCGKHTYISSDGSFELDFSKITIIDFFYSEKNNSGDWGHTADVVFSYDKGYGVATDEFSGDYTFTSEGHHLYLMETSDPALFWNLILTEDQRQRLQNFAIEVFLLERK